MLVDLHSLNPWAIVVATVAAFFIGGIWYAPPVFGNRWMAALGKTKDQLTGPVKPMVTQFFATLACAAVLAVVISRFGAVTWIEGAATGFVLAVGLVATTQLGEWMFCNFSMRLYWIQVSFKIVNFTVMGAILGAWR